MDCPICRVPLKEIDYEGVKVDHCKKCDGFWLDQGELRKINRIHKERFSPKQIAEAQEMLVKKAIVARSTEERRIDCPHCGKPCKQVSLSGVVIDECPDGAGIWLDKDEIEKLQIMAEERAQIFTKEERAESRKRQEAAKLMGSLDIFDKFSVFIGSLFAR